MNERERESCGPVVEVERRCGGLGGGMTGQELPDGRESAREKDRFL